MPWVHHKDYKLIKSFHKLSVPAFLGGFKITCLLIGWPSRNADFISSDLVFHLCEIYICVKHKYIIFHLCEIISHLCNLIFRLCD